MSVGMINYKKSFITKVRDFLKKVFGRKESIQEQKEKKLNYINQNDFKESLQVKPNAEEIKIINLQKEYKAGKIKEEDMTDEEHKKLIELYEMQNKELEEEIKLRKVRIKNKLDDMKAS